MSNEIITLVKDTSLARAIALQEVIWAAESFMKGNQGISGLWWPLMFTAVYYLLSALVTMCWAGWKRSWTTSGYKGERTCRS